jgi:hypothetical protein
VELKIKIKKYIHIVYCSFAMPFILLGNKTTFGIEN